MEEWVIESGRAVVDLYNMHRVQILEDYSPFSSYLLL